MPKQCQVVLSLGFKVESPGAIEENVETQVSEASLRSTEVALRSTKRALRSIGETLRSIELEFLEMDVCITGL